MTAITKSPDRILVTGAGGQLGSEIRQLAPNFDRFEFVFTDLKELDVTNADACCRLVGELDPAFILNCAAYTAVDRAETDVETSRRLNVGAVRNLVQACVDSPSKTRFIHISTDYVYGGESCRPYVETDPVAPQSEYGRSKLAGEYEALSLTGRSMVIRTSWLYSAFGNNFVKTMRRLGGERESLDVVFDQTGTPTYAGDLAAAILRIADATASGEKQFVGGIYNYSNEGVCSWYDFACAVMKLFHLDCKVNPVETAAYPTAAKRPHFSVMNKAKIKSTFDLKINHWTESLRKL
jgi:dTDP-4-dehydrorhamnose reductase